VKREMRRNIISLKTILIFTLFASFISTSLVYGYYCFSTRMPLEIILTSFLTLFSLTFALASSITLPVTYLVKRRYEKNDEGKI